MKKYVIIVAGGKGLRMGGDVPKQFMMLGDRPVLIHTLEAFYRCDPEIRTVLVLPGEQVCYWENLCAGYGFTVPHSVVKGGETRFHSVKNGLAMIERELEAGGQKEAFNGTLVGVHDGVRPLVDCSIIMNVFERACSGNGAYPAVPVTDSIREFTVAGRESRPVDRTKYFLVQTPQVFRADILMTAYRQEYRPEFTDDVSVVESAGICKPAMVEGSRRNIKLTAPIDFVIAGALMQNLE
jgi:2-C-methyl-D-erythritol 4-phosphate cytidylyltransferase